jgi:hypothetical protein
MRRYASTLVLSALALGLGGYIAWIERKAPSTSELRDKDKRVVRDLDRQAIRAIRLERDAETVVLKKDGETWRIEKPVAFPADSGAVESLLSAVEFLDLQRRIDGGKPAEYGLDKPRARIEIEGGAPVRLRVGADDATGRSVYVSAESGPVWVVERNFLDALQKPIADLRDRHVIRADRTALKTITLAKDGVRTTLERSGEDWVLVGDGKVMAAADRVSAILARIEGTQATRVVAEGLADLAKYGLDPAARSVEIDAGGVETLLVGNACGESSGEVYAARKGKASAIFCVKDDDADGWFADPALLRETRLVPFSADDVERATIEAGGRKLALARKDGKWKMVDPAQSADGDVVTKWLADLAAFRATENVAFDAARQGLVRPARVTLEAGGRTLALAFGKTGSGATFVRRGEEPSTMKVHAEVAGLLDPSPLAFRKRRVLDFSRYDVKRLIARSGGLEEDARKLDAGGWRLDRPAKLPGDDAVIDEVSGALSELRAERFLAAGEARGLAQPSRVLVATVEPPAGGHDHDPEDAEEDDEDGGDGDKPAGKQEITLQLGAALADGTCHVRVEGKGPAFVVAEKACKSLRSPLVTRKLFDLDESKIVAFALVRAAEEVALEKRGPEWHRKGGGRIDAARIEDLLGLIRNARAAGVVGYRKGAIASPRLSLTVRTDGQADQRVDVGGPAGEGLEAGVAGREAAYVVDIGFAEALERLSF